MSAYDQPIAILLIGGSVLVSCYVLIRGAWRSWRTVGARLDVAITDACIDAALEEGVRARDDFEAWEDECRCSDPYDWRADPGAFGERGECA